MFVFGLEGLRKGLCGSGGVPHSAQVKVDIIWVMAPEGMCMCLECHVQDVCLQRGVVCVGKKHQMPGSAAGVAITTRHAVIPDYAKELEKPGFGNKGMKPKAKKSGKRKK
jgi:hypothetical protein